MVSKNCTSFQNFNISLFENDPEFYDFTRSLKAYRETFKDRGDILLIDPDSDYFKYLNKSEQD